MERVRWLEEAVMVATAAQRPKRRRRAWRSPTRRAAKLRNRIEYLTFLLGDEMFAIGILSIREIIEYGVVTDVPMTPPFIRGVLNCAVRSYRWSICRCALAVGGARTPSARHRHRRDRIAQGQPGDGHWS